jgi:hypothetical protein
MVKVEAFFVSPHFNNDLQPVPGALSALQSLKQHYDLQIVTARSDELMDQTKAWINKHFPDIFTEIHFGNAFSREGKPPRSKLEICRDIRAVMLVEDQPQYSTQCAEAGIPVILFGDYPWNGKSTQHVFDAFEGTFSSLEEYSFRTDVRRSGSSAAINASADITSTPKSTEAAPILRMNSWEDLSTLGTKLISMASEDGTKVPSSTIKDMLANLPPTVMAIKSVLNHFYGYSSMSRTTSFSLHSPTMLAQQQPASPGLQKMSSFRSAGPTSLTSLSRQGSTNEMIGGELVTDVHAKSYIIHTHMNAYIHTFYVTIFACNFVYLLIRTTATAFTKSRQVCLAKGARLVSTCLASRCSLGKRAR